MDVIGLGKQGKIYRKHLRIRNQTQSALGCQACFSDTLRRSTCYQHLCKDLKFERHIPHTMSMSRLQLLQLLKLDIQFNRRSHHGSLAGYAALVSAVIIMSPSKTIPRITS